MRQLQISGEVLTDEASIKKYSTDMSHYTVKPMMIAVPANTEDLLRIVAYSKEEAIPLTPRGAGSNQSGSAVGSGIIVLFSKMTTTIMRKGRTVKVQPGIIHQVLDQQLSTDGFRIPYDPTSRSFCTIGGNVATKASGLRSLKYGTVDSALRSLCFCDVAHGLIDTSEGLPEKLEKEIVDLKNRLRNDQETITIMDTRRDLKSSSGYNLKSFFEHEEPEEIVTHLLAGSVGTLGVFSEVELEAVPALKDTNLYLMFFRSIVDATEDVAQLKIFDPSAIEAMDSYGVDLLRNEVSVPSDCRAVLLVEFDSNLEQANEVMLSHLNEKSIKFLFETEAKKQRAIWRIRESMLPWIMNNVETPTKKFPPFADDLAIPVNQMPSFLASIQDILVRFGTVAVIYGHAGEGNLHIRPMINKKNWEENLRNLSNLIFEAALRTGGTITGEHGLGRNRSMYLRNEWGDKIYGYFEQIKKIFDPEGLLNPDVVFTSNDLTKSLSL